MRLLIHQDNDFARSSGNADLTTVFLFHFKLYFFSLVEINRKNDEKVVERETDSRDGRSFHPATQCLEIKRYQRFELFLPANSASEFPLVKIHLGRRCIFKEGTCLSLLT